jgi:hypothetical protein
MFLEETRVMTDDLSLMDDATRAWIEEKKQAIMSQRNIDLCVCYLVHLEFGLCPLLGI